MNSSCPGKPVTKPDPKRITITLLRVFLLFFAGVFLSACQVNEEDANGNDPT